ncbi:hypothetical protein FRB93_003070 [Tulasnella sp. JGI-2019a]|nr:hypothetical protein FRB93_003070 [Tulasnella sp. JGI-2019a]
MVAQIYGWAVTEQFIMDLARRENIGTESQRTDILWTVLNLCNWLDATFPEDMVQIQDGRPIKSDASKRSGFKCIGPRSLVMGVPGEYYTKGSEKQRAEVLDLLDEMKEVIGFEKPVAKYKRYL